MALLVLLNTERSVFVGKMASKRQKQDVAKAILDSDSTLKNLQPGMQASSPEEDHVAGDKEDASSRTQGRRPDSGIPDTSLAPPLHVTSYFNELSANLVRRRVSLDKFSVFRSGVEQLLKECGYKKG